MPTARVNDDVDVHYESLGHEDDPPLLLVAGLATQLTMWHEEFCLGLVDRGFRVIRFDNRDVGLSTWFDQHEVDLLAAIATVEAGEPLDAPYLLTDMAADSRGLIEALSIDEPVHVVGASMGGMIAQTLAIEHPWMVASLTSIMSSTGEPDIGQPSAEALTALLEPAPTERSALLDHGARISRIWASPEQWDEEWVRSRYAEDYERAHHPAAGPRHMLALVASGERASGLADLSVPALVVHGDADTLIDKSGGERTAELIPDAELLVLEGMGHDLPPNFWSAIIERITALAVRSSNS